jgi:hypothetical protein
MYLYSRDFDNLSSCPAVPAQQGMRIGVTNRHTQESAKENSDLRSRLAVGDSSQ